MKEVQLSFCLTDDQIEQLKKLMHKKTSVSSDEIIAEAKRMLTPESGYALDIKFDIFQILIENPIKE